MAWTYDYLNTAASFDASVLDNDKQRFAAAEEKKAVLVRAGITEDVRATQLAQQNLILSNCLSYKAQLMRTRGTPMADETQWNYTASLFPVAARNQWRLDKLKEIEGRRFSFERQREKIVTNTDPLFDVVNPVTQKTRRQALLDSIDVQLLSIELEKAERIRDQSTLLT
jgi:hypothetical protein